jgi:hypothetical protein
MKLLMVLSTLALSTGAMACPELQGRYDHCYSEVRTINGEYIVDQHQENFYQVYNVEYNDDETGENRKEEIKTNNELISSKQTLPRVGVRVRLEARARCAGTKVISDADAFFMGAKVGSFTNEIFLDGNTLRSNLDGSYLGKEIHKRIVCTLKK